MTEGEWRGRCLLDLSFLIGYRGLITLDYDPRRVLGFWWEHDDDSPPWHHIFFFPIPYLGFHLSYTKGRKA